MTAWFLIVVLMMADGSTNLIKMVPQSPEYATEQACNVAKDLIVERNKKQKSPKIKKASAFCLPISETELDKLLPPKA